MDFAAPLEAGAAGFVAASFDGVTLVLDQLDVSSVEESGMAGEMTSGIGSFELDGVLFPAFRLAAALELAEGEARKYLLVVSAGARTFGLVCDAVRPLARSRVRLEELPERMRTGDSPARAVARLPDGVGFYCPASAIATLLLSRREATDGPG